MGPPINHDAANADFWMVRLPRLFGFSMRMSIRELIKEIAVTNARFNRIYEVNCGGRTLVAALAHSLAKQGRRA